LITTRISKSIPVFGMDSNNSLKSPTYCYGSLVFYRYSWTKDGAALRITGIDMKVLPGAGTLVIEEPSSHHDGVYQCLARNQYGVALSVRSVLRLAGQSKLTKLCPSRNVNRFYYALLFVYLTLHLVIQ